MNSSANTKSNAMPDKRVTRIKRMREVGDGGNEL